MTAIAAAVTTFDKIMSAGGCVLVGMGVFLLFNIAGAADRAARRGAELKQGYPGRQVVDSDVRAIMPTTRAGARRLGAFVVVFIGLGIYVVLTGQ